VPLPSVRRVAHTQSHSFSTGRRVSPSYLTPGPHTSSLFLPTCSSWESLTRSHRSEITFVTKNTLLCFNYVTSHIGGGSCARPPATGEAEAEDHWWPAEQPGQTPPQEEKARVRQLLVLWSSKPLLWSLDHLEQEIFRHTVLQPREL
jgi:hypothetical protein